MLNKELLLSLENSDPILMRVGANEFTWARFGYERSHDPFGSINRIPIWYTGGGSLLLSALYYDENRDRTYIRSDSHTKDQVDLTITILGRSTQLSLLGAGANFATERDPLNLKELWDKTVQVTFDPPPTGTSIHNSHEASTEESVDAQQGITNDGRWDEGRESYFANRLVFKPSRDAGYKGISKRCTSVHRTSKRYYQTCRGESTGYYSVRHGCTFCHKPCSRFKCKPYIRRSVYSKRCPVCSVYSSRVHRLKLTSQEALYVE